MPKFQDKNDKRTARQEVVIFDYLTVSTNAIGKCWLTMMQTNADSQFQLHSLEYKSTLSNVKWTRTRAIKRPLFILFVTYRLSMQHVLRRLKGRSDQPITMQTETCLAGSDVYYMHFCHSLYLQQFKSSVKKINLSNIARYFDHTLHALAERKTLSAAKLIVVPTRRLANELETIGVGADKIRVIGNPIPATGDSSTMSTIKGVCPPTIKDEGRLLFVAAGQFQRKGLHKLIQALAAITDGPALTILGGSKTDLAEVETWVKSANICSDRVTILGKVPNVTDYMRSHGALIVASDYEVMPMIMLEALSTGCIILSTPVGGTDEMVEDGHNGLLAAGFEVEDIIRLIDMFRTLDLTQRERMRELSLKKAAKFSAQEFGKSWSDVIKEVRTN